MNKTEITWSAFIWNHVESGHGRIVRVEPVLRANLGERGSTGRVDCAIASPEPAMLLASSHPHDHFSIKVMGARIILWAMDHPCHRCVSIEAAVDGLVAVRRGRVLHVVGDVRCRLPLVGQSICHELGARLATK